MTSELWFRTVTIATAVIVGGGTIRCEGDN